MTRNMQCLLYTIAFVVFCGQLVQAAPLTFHYPSLRWYSPCKISSNAFQPSEVVESERSGHNEQQENAAKHLDSGHSSNWGLGISCSRPFTVKLAIGRENIDRSTISVSSPAYHGHARDGHDYGELTRLTRIGGKAVTCIDVKPGSRAAENRELRCSCVADSSNVRWHGLALPVLVMITIGMTALFIGRKCQQNKDGHGEPEYSSLASSDVERNEKWAAVSVDQDVESFDDSDYPMG